MRRESSLLETASTTKKILHKIPVRRKARMIAGFFVRSKEDAGFSNCRHGNGRPE